MVGVIRKRLSYANVMVTLALVFAMAGGAFAAHGVTAAKHHRKHKTPPIKITSVKQISPSVLAALKGAAGPSGPEGKEGKPGAPGAAGKDGVNGVSGKDGASVTGSPLAPGEGGCSAGGVAFTSTSGTNSVCDGQTGYAETLPSNKTLRGQWTTEWIAGSAGSVASDSISFPFRVENTAGEGPLVVFVKAKEATPAHCTGDSKDPGAEPGYLCVFATLDFNASPAITNWSTVEPGTASTTGFDIVSSSEGSGPAAAAGTWAVTAE